MMGESKPSIILTISGGVIETFVFGIVKVCENGKMVLKRRSDLSDDLKMRNLDSRGKNTEQRWS